MCRVEGILAVPAERAQHVELLVGKALRHDLEGHGVAGDVPDAQHHGLVDEDLVELDGQLVEHLPDDPDDLVRILQRMNLDIGEGGRPPLGDVADLGDLAVAQVPGHAVPVADARHPQSDVLDNPLDLVDAHRVADPVLVLEDDEKSRQDILDERLRAEGQGDADDSGGGQDWGDLDANGAESRQQGDDDDDGNADIREQSADGCRALILPCLLYTSDAADE